MTLRVISLGWGVQSFALAAMSALGELPPVDAAIHADTGHERSETYAFAKRWTPWLEARGVRVVTVNPDPRYVQPFGVTPTVSSLPQMMIPAYKLFPDGKGGMIPRQCTGHWKIRPMRRWIQAHRDGAQAQQWIGITLDEWTRMRNSDVQYIENIYPYMDLFNRPWRRGDVLRWLNDARLEIPPKSACTFCPFHDQDTWHEIKASDNGDWAAALQVDRAIRDRRDGYKCFLHRSCQPLDQVDLRNEQDHGQLTLWDEEECSGMCFL